MNILQKCVMKGLWDSKDLEISFNKNVNFLIGPNGSGKTTIINLIVAALTVDIRAILQFKFTKIVLTLNAIKGRKKPIIEVERNFDRTTNSNFITYKIRSSTTASPYIHRLEDVDELLRYYSTHSKRRFVPDRVLGTSALKDKLVNLLDLSWLSIHRARSFRRLEDEESYYDSTVDSKLADLSNEFVRYFSSLAQQASLELTKFQESVFLSMLMKREQSWFKSSSKSVDLQAEKHALIEIYEELKVDEHRYKRRVDEHFFDLKKTLSKLELGKATTFTADEFATLITNFRVDDVVREWRNLRERQKKIFEPRETFLSVLNNLMINKQFSINAKNELTVTLKNEKILSINRLSSGEKQMVIILGEALLQHQSASLYIADEPELSLHIEWQQSLIDNIRAVNPAAQIIFATHSPDIVGKYSMGVIDVEEIMH